MNEEISILLSSHAYNSSVDQLHDALQILVRKIRFELQSATQQNHAKHSENEALKQELASLQQKVVAKEAAHRDDVDKLAARISSEAARHCAIKQHLFDRMSSARSAHQSSLSEHSAEMNLAHAAIDGLKHDTFALELKVQAVLQSHDRLMSQHQDLAEEHQRSSAESSDANEKNQRKMSEMNAQSLAQQSTIQALGVRNLHLLKLQSAMDAVLAPALLRAHFEHAALPKRVVLVQPQPLLSELAL